MFCVLFIYFILPSYKINNSLIFIKSAVYVRPNIPNIERHTPKKEAAYEYIHTTEFRGGLLQKNNRKLSQTAT